MGIERATLIATLGVLISGAVSAQEDGVRDQAGHSELTELSRLYLEVDPPDLVDFFEPKEFRPPGSEQDGPSLPYRIFEPDQQDAEEKYPLIVWLHGFGGVETHWYNRNRGQLKHTHMVFPDRSDRSKYPFYFIAPQNSTFESWAAQIDGAEDGATYSDWLLALIDELIETKNVDASRVTMIGVSSGAASCWGVAAKRPDLFAAVAPLSGVAGVESLDGLTSIPIWTFHTRERGLESAYSSVDYLRSKEGCAQLTLIPNDYHDTWSAALNHYHLIDWLLERRKGEACPCTAELPELPGKNPAGDSDSATESKSMGETLKEVWAYATRALPAAMTLFTFALAALVAFRPPGAVKRLLSGRLK